MIYTDKAYPTHIQEWRTLEVIYIAESQNTDYAALGAKLDAVVDYDLPDGVASTAVLGSGGSFDVQAEAGKRAQADQHTQISAMANRQEQSERDTGVPKVSQSSPSGYDDDSMGSDLEADPVEF